MRPPDAVAGATSTSVGYDWIQVPAGSRIRGSVTCAARAEVCDIQAVILFDTARAVTIEVLEEFDLSGSSVELDVPLFELEGENVRFVLAVRADTTADAVAVWRDVKLVEP